MQPVSSSTTARSTTSATRAASSGFRRIRTRFWAGRHRPTRRPRREERRDGVPGDRDDLHLPDGSRGPASRPRGVPEMRHGARAGPLDRADHARRVHLPDAPGDRARSAGRLPDLRHGAGAAHGRPRGRTESRADRHDAALPARRAARGAGVPARDGRHGRWRRASAAASTCALDELARPRCSPRRSCCGPAGRSSSAAGRRSSTAARTCSR